MEGMQQSDNSLHISAVIHTSRGALERRTAGSAIKITARSLASSREGRHGRSLSAFADVREETGGGGPATSHRGGCDPGCCFVYRLYAERIRWLKGVECPDIFLTTDNHRATQ